MLVLVVVLVLDASAPFSEAKKEPDCPANIGISEDEDDDEHEDEKGLGNPAKQAYHDPLDREFRSREKICVGRIFGFKEWLPVIEKIAL